MWYRNTNERYGFAGPFEAESEEALADEMRPSLESWADELIERSGSLDDSDGPSRESIIANMRQEFIDALEAVEE